MARLLILLILAAPDAAPANDAGAPDAAAPSERKAVDRDWQKACQQDLQRLCKDEVPPRGSPRGCLRANEDRLSDRCYDVAIRPGRHALLCVPDLNRFCRDRPIKEFADCLKEHRRELTDGCRAAEEHRHRLPKAPDEVVPAR
jgi:hypothetical protein